MRCCRSDRRTLGVASSLSLRQSACMVSLDVLDPRIRRGARGKRGYGRVRGAIDRRAQLVDPFAARAGAVIGIGDGDLVAVVRELRLTEHAGWRLLNPDEPGVARVVDRVE